MLNLNSVDRSNVGEVYHNLSAPDICEQAIRLGEAMLGHVENFEEFRELAGDPLVAAGPSIQR